MEFTQVLKKGAAILFLVLLAHGLILGFSAASTILSVVLASVTCLFEAQLVKSERQEQEQRLNNIVSELQLMVNKVSEQQGKDKKEINTKLDDQFNALNDKLEYTKSSIQTLKINSGIRKV